TRSPRSRKLSLRPRGWVSRAAYTTALDVLDADRIREQTRSRHAAIDRQVDRRRDEHRGLGVALAVLADEFRTNDSHDHERRRPPLDHLADVLADPLECIEPLALDLVGQDLDLDAREVFGQLATSSLAMLAWRL